MILANVAAAETLERAKAPLIYRVHDEPALEKLEALREFLATLDISLPKGGALRPDGFNRILARVRGGDSEALVNEVVLRSQAQAEYSAENYGHFGLNLRRYAHFTSPIRRYADLVVHRALIRALELGDDGLPAGATTGSLGEIAAQISATERRAMSAERETVDRLIAHFLADRVGATFTGRIGGVTRSGLFVKLADTGADGFIPAATLGDDYFRYDERGHALIGDATGESLPARRPGDRAPCRGGPRRRRVAVRNAIGGSQRGARGTPPAIVSQSATRRPFHPAPASATPALNPHAELVTWQEPNS